MLFRDMALRRQLELHVAIIVALHDWMLLALREERNRICTLSMWFHQQTAHHLI